LTELLVAYVDYSDFLLGWVEGFNIFNDESEITIVVLVTSNESILPEFE
jgi:hypothetical protein